MRFYPIPHLIDSQSYGCVYEWQCPCVILRATFLMSGRENSGIDEGFHYLFGNCYAFTEGSDSKSEAHNLISLFESCASIDNHLTMEYACQ